MTDGVVCYLSSVKVLVWAEGKLTPTPMAQFVPLKMFQILVLFFSDMLWPGVLHADLLF